ncbi:HlyD family efflux transporter periplasmic adaptor subunit [Microcoleus sp. FACHB-1515]|uniref:HlyD family efflux transporter periplasmic adaptor subunit n=1 Tax=Cyanophyceae TaxID=3028117 RepID=UPI001682A4C6|nr:HlyD family efflux transporter periplasmic adaptor subunit [Microcoleus sp. FACHB-1515]MBD2091811.1 HlyD family efflux transporter periplasmic adaptor subunit [Microcoleus sp. FACHB-1515]
MTITDVPRKPKQGRNRNNQGRNILIVLLLLLLPGLGFFAFRTYTQRAEQQAIEEAAPPPQQVTVAALGRLEPEGEVVRVGGPAGERIARMLVAEGDYVQQGQILAVLETYDQQQAQRDVAASELAEARSRLAAITQSGQAEIQEAQTRVSQVDRPQAAEVQAQAATIRQLQAELDLAQIELRRTQDLVNQGAVARQQLDQRTSELRQRQEALNSARAELVRLQTARNSDLSNAQAQVQSAEAELTRSQAEVTVQSAARNLQLAEAQLARTVIRAPRTGEVLRIHTKTGEAIAAGGSGTQEQGILELGNTRQMDVVAEVYETDIGRVRVGQTATITSRNGAFSETLTGRVTRIGSQIFKNNILDDDPAANADARVVEVRIRLDQSEPVRQLTNLQVDVRIDVEGAPSPVTPSPSPTATSEPS